MVMLFILSFEDTRDVPTLLDVQALNLPPHALCIDSTDITDVEKLRLYVSKVKYRGRPCHNSPGQTLAFKAELEVYTWPTFESPHVAQFIGYTSNEFAKVTGFVLPYYDGGDLKWALRLRKYPERYQEDSKFRWAAQIAHALVALHQSGLTHGDLRCKNVVLDHEGNAIVIDMVRGWGYMDGWALDRIQNGISIRWCDVGDGSRWTRTT
jgi:serine/threonine protein kinase